MVVIRFPDPEMERRALGFLAGRFPFKTSSTGDTLIPETALAALAREGLRYSVEGPAAYDKLVPPLRNPASAAV